MELIIVRQCTHCKNTYEATTEYFYQCKKTKIGLAAKCKKCVYLLFGESSKIRSKKYHHNNKEKVSKKAKRYAEINKERIAVYQTTYREENREKHKEYMKKYYDDNKDEMKKYKKAHYQTNKLEYREHQRNNRELYNHRLREFYRKNPERLKIYKQTRITRKKNVEANFSLKEWQECKEHFNSRCAYCGKPRMLAQDHFVPLSKGGEYTKNNIIPACRSCNSSKQDKSFFEWYPSWESFNKDREQRIINYLNYKTPNAQQLTLII